MTDQPPSPPTPTVPAAADGDHRIVATTTQLTAAIENSLGLDLDDGVLETLLLELDRGAYVEWVTVTREGEYVWDLTDSPDRIAEAVASLVVDRLVQWLEPSADE